MIEVMDNLFVGTEWDYEEQVKGRLEWAVVQACKHPYHREALGYKGNAAPKDHSEYLVAPRGNRLILNMIDTADPKYIPKEMIDRALCFIAENLRKGKKVLVHCNQGQSRGPSIALLYMATVGRLPKDSFSTAELQFGHIYKSYAPAEGIRQFLRSHWEAYTR